MKRVGRDAVLDEASVQQADQRAADWKQPRRRAPRTPTAPLLTIRVDPRIWASALAIADGNAKRIQVHSTTDVTVHNNPWRREASA